MTVVGVTGSLASGKSEVVGLLKRKGAVVFDADRAAHAALKPGSATASAVRRLFGTTDRRKLAERVFSHPGDLKKLNILVHPWVIMDCLKVITRCRDRRGMLVLDVPLLFESHMQNLADVVIVVSAPRERLLERARKRGLPPALARRILARQWPIRRKEKLADIVIRNDGTRAELVKKVNDAAARIAAIIRQKQL